MGISFRTSQEALRGLLGGLALASAVISSACSAGGETPAAAAGGGRGTASATPAVPVTTAAVEQKSVPLAIDVIGTSEAFHTVAVHAQVTGELNSVRFKEGDDVKE